MNRICFVLSDKGELEGIAADAPVEIYIVAPHVPHDRVYLYQSAQFGPQFVRELIGGFAVGHSDDGVIGDGDGRGKLTPSKPHIGVIP